MNGQGTILYLLKQSFQPEEFLNAWFSDFRFSSELILTREQRDLVMNMAIVRRSINETGYRYLGFCRSFGKKMSIERGPKTDRGQLRVTEA